MKRSIRRLPAAVAVSLGAALLMVPTPAQASATVLSSSLNIYSGIYDDYDECDVNTSGTFYADNTSASGNLSLSVAGSATAVNPGDAADTGAGSVSVQASIASSVAGGRLSVQAAISSNAAVSTALGAASECQMYGYAYGYGSLRFRVVSGGSVALSIPQSVGWSYLGIGRAVDATYSDQAWNVSLARTAPTISLPLAAGYYELYFDLDGDSVSAPPSTYASSTSAGSARMNATFTPTPPPPPPAVKKGVAKGSVKGAGKKFVKLPASLACGSGSAQVTFTKKAKKVQKVDVLAGKKKVKTVKAPKKGKVKITKLPKGAVKLTVKLKLKNGKKAQVARAYTAC